MRLFWTHNSFLLAQVLLETENKASVHSAISNATDNNGENSLPLLAPALFVVCVCVQR